MILNTDSTSFSNLYLKDQKDNIPKAKFPPEGKSESGRKRKVHECLVNAESKVKIPKIDPHSEDKENKTVANSSCSIYVTTLKRGFTPPPVDSSDGNTVSSQKLLEMAERTETCSESERGYFGKWLTAITPYIHHYLQRFHSHLTRQDLQVLLPETIRTRSCTPAKNEKLRNTKAEEPSLLPTEPPPKKRKRSAEYYFTNNPLSKQQVIDHLMTNQPPLSVLCIRSTDDLEKHGLVQQTWLEAGELKKAEGRLFGHEPLTLIIDLTLMSADTASINDILQVNPSFTGTPLGDQVRRVLLVNDDMITGKQISSADLWVRLQKMSSPGLDTNSSPTAITDEALLAAKTLDKTPANKTAITIDFATSDDWSLQLFGGITYDDKGQLSRVDGALAQLPENPHLIIRNAPLDSPAFEAEIATALRKCGFEACGVKAGQQWVTLPGNITLTRERVSDAQLYAMKDKAIQDKPDEDKSEFNPRSPFVCLNSSTMDSLNGQLRVDGSRVVRHNRLAALTEDCQQLVITSPLDRQQWLRLLTQLDLLPENKRPLLFANQWPSSLTPADLPHWSIARDSEHVRHSGPADYFDYEVNPDDSLESLQQVNLTSQKHSAFSLTNSHLLECLVNGTPVILSGLERNPELAASLETLLLPNPYLFIHGHKINLPGARVTLIKPAAGQSTGSSLIDQAFIHSDHPGSQRQPAEMPIYSLLNSLPRCYRRTYPDRPPWSPDVFQHRFDRQVEAERQLDGSPGANNGHRRRALHVLLAKAYRGNPAVYGFIKAKIARYYPDQPADHRADRSALAQWLSKHPDPTLKVLRNHFWELARHCPADVHNSANELNTIDDQAVKKLAAYVAGAAAGQSRQQRLARRLKISPKRVEQQRFFDGTLRSTLRDALIASKASLKPHIISETLARLESEIAAILKSTQSDQQPAQQIKATLGMCYQNHQLPANYQDLPDTLVANQRHTHAWQERRLARLARQIQEHPLIFLQGEAGAGKSFMAQAIAARTDRRCQVIQLGPNGTSETLFGGQQLIRCKTDSGIDHVTEFRQGPLLQWALSENPPLLILDEANLAPEGLLAPLAGLTRQPPVIHFQGRQYPLIEQHRIILTGNPDHYQGRHLDDTLKSRIPTFFYHPLPETVLAESIILTDLPDRWSAGQKQQACERLLTLFRHFRSLVPGDLTTPRDIKDVLATIRQILSYHPAPDALSPEQVNALIRRAFIDSLAGAVPQGQQQRLGTLNSWYRGQFPEDDTVVEGVDAAFADFLERLRTENQDADFSPTPIQQLVYRYWQSLDKDDRGRIGTLVEGPSGWGKDFTLDKTIRLWQKKRAEAQQPVKPFEHINANPNQWSILVDLVNSAMKQGQVIVISELNLLPGSYLEGLFNDVLTGHAAAGFRLFGTINPASFAGRETLGAALKSRCTLVRLGALSQQELEGLVKRLSGVPVGLPRWLAGHFQQLSSALDAQQSPVQLALGDLLSTANHLARKAPEQWHDAFQRHLLLPFRALNTPLPTLPPFSENEERIARQQNTEQRRLECERIVNSVPGLREPVTVRFGKHLRTGKGEITVPENITDQGLKNIVQAMHHRATATEEQQKRVQPDPGKASTFKFTSVVPKHFKVTRYFPKSPYDARQYRLRFLETQLDKDGQLHNYPITWSDGKPHDLADWPDIMAWRTELREDELPGKCELLLNEDWKPLPALTPSDQLRAIRVKSAIEIALARSEKTGQLLIKAQNGLSRSVEIDFIIAPEQAYFNQLTLGEPLITQENLCTPWLQQLLDDRVFYPDECDGEVFAQLRTINEIEEIPERLSALMDWLDTFSSDKYISGQGEALLLGMMGEKQGACGEKSTIFQILCHYWGIPARQVRNASHSFVEISPDGGNTWRQYQLGGGGQTSADITEPDWGDYQPSAHSTLRPPKERSLNSISMTGNVDLSHLSISQSIMLSWEDQQTSLQNMPKDQVQKITDHYYNQVQQAIIRGSGSCYDFIEFLSSNNSKYIRDDQKWISLLNRIINIISDRKPEHMKNNLENNCAVEINSDVSEQPDNDYIEWLCNLCEVNELIKNHIAGNLQSYYQTQKNSHHFFMGKIAGIARKMTFPKPDMHTLETKTEHQKWISFAISLPKSKYLQDKIVTTGIEKKYTLIPRNNSKLIPERLASGQPMYLSQCALKINKPVIIDCFSFKCSRKTRETFYDETGKIIGNKRLIDIIIKDRDLTDLKQCRSNSWEEMSCYFRIVLEGIYNKNLFLIFIAWLSQHQADETKSWQWFMNSYTDCYEQKNWSTPPIEECKYSSYYLAFDFSSEEIKEQLKQPSAVVIRKKELSILFDEFLDIMKAH